jgi:hypothetical protein
MFRKLGLLIVVFLLVACSGKPFQPATTTASPTPFRATSLPPRPTATQPGPRVNYTTSGTISRDETWRGEIHITGDILMANGATLSIEPGTMVYLASNSDDQHMGMESIDDYIREHNDPVGYAEWDQNAILIDGRNGIINAVGTAEQPITFRPEGDSTSPGQWYGIFLEKGSLQHSIVLYGGRTAVQVVPYSDGVVIAYNEVRYAHWSNIIDYGQNTWIHHNIIEGGGHQALNSGLNSLVENNIVMNSQTCMAVDEKGTIRNNLFIDCARGIRVAFGEDIRVINNTIAWVKGPPDGWYYQGSMIYPAFEATHGISIVRSLPGTVILNNIIYGPYQYAIDLMKDPGERSVIDYNMMWNQPGQYSGEWQSAVIGAHNSVQNPLFADTAVGDFRLLPRSPAIDAGSPEILDAEGSPSDLGAYGGPQGDGW